jgi:hypothetical protein
MLQYYNDQLAFNKAQGAFQDAISMGSAYGYAPGGDWTTWGNGGPTQPAAGTPTLQLQQIYGANATPAANQSTLQALQQYGQMYGTSAVPGADQQTLASQQQAAAIAAAQAQMTGYYQAPSMYAPGTFVQDPSSGAYYQVQSNGSLAPYQGTPTTTAVQGPQGIGATAGQGQQTLAAQQQAFQQQLQTAQFQQQGAQSYLNLLAQLQGPADYGQYLKVLGSTPSGIQGLVNSAAGQYIAGGGVSGTAPQAQTLQNLVGAAGGYAGGGTGANAATQTYGQQQQGGTASPGGMNYQDFLAQAQGLPPPSQIAPQSFNNMQASQKQMLGSMYANVGYSPQDINSMYQLSLPKYAAGSAAGQTKLV